MKNTTIVRAGEFVESNGMRLYSDGSTYNYGGELVPENEVPASLRDQASIAFSNNTVSGPIDWK